MAFRRLLRYGNGNQLISLRLYGDLSEILNVLGGQKFRVIFFLFLERKARRAPQYSRTALARIPGSAVTNK